jgi:hypothetical protein
VFGRQERKAMANLQVQNTFEPYYAGRNGNDAARWIIRKKDESAEAGREKGAEPEQPAAPDSKSN